MDTHLFSYHNIFDLNRNVLRTHKFSDLDAVKKENVLYIYTYRNPISASISNFRICTRKITSLKSFAHELANRHINYLKASEKMEAEGKDIQRFRYEDFSDNIEELLDAIERTFHIAIDLKDKELIKEGYSKASIYANTAHLNSFEEYLPISGFHGCHVSADVYDPPEEFLHWLKIYVDKAKPLFQKYGYFVEN
jgi:hypothetical protein